VKLFFDFFSLGEGNRKEEANGEEAQDGRQDT
jgi:hypothetical protein